MAVVACAIGATRASCSTVRSVRPGRFVTDVATHHAVPRRGESSAGSTALRSGDAGNRRVSERQVGARGQLSPLQAVREVEVE